MIRILHYGLSENRGGIETYLSKLWTNIDRNEYHFDFIDTNVGKPCFHDEFSEMGSKFFKITPRKISNHKNKKDLEDLFRKEKFDILHCHLNTLSYITPIKIALKHGCKVIVHSRSSNSPASIVTKILHNINYFLMIPNFKKTINISVSNKAGKWLFREQIPYSVINNSVNIDKFRFSMNARNSYREKLNLENKFIIGHIGAYLYPKNHFYLLDVFKCYLEYKKNAVLILVGDGPLKETIQDKVRRMNINDKVMFLGNRMDIAELLSTMDILVFPSYYEGFPNVILEAQTSGLPCLISDSITNEVIVIRDICRKLSLSINPDIWAKTILELENVCNNRMTSFSNIKESGFSVENEIKKIEDIYNLAIRK